MFLPLHSEEGKVTVVRTTNPTLYFVERLCVKCAFYNLPLCLVLGIGRPE
jgi:hypothetical protein